MRILIVDDDRELAQLLRRGLAQEGYAVDLAHDGEEGEGLARSVPYDLIILDIMLLLFLARDESNQSIRMENVNLVVLLSDLGQDAEVLGESKNIRFHFEYASQPIVKGDQTLLKELFLNLLDNAVKYTPENGRIDMSLRMKDNNATVAIADTGIGVPAEYLPELFRRFYRVDYSRSSKTGGAGLGLAICQRIVELHSGKITVESEVGKGSIFTIFLPLYALRHDC